MASLKKLNGIFYLQCSLGGNIRRVSTGTDSPQLAKDKKRKLASSLFRGDLDALPTNTRIGDVIDDYVKHIRVIKTAMSARCAPQAHIAMLIMHAFECRADLDAE